MWSLIVAVVVVLLVVAVGIRSTLRQRRRRRLLADSDYAGRDALPGERAIDPLDRAAYEMRTRANNNFPNGYGGF